MQVFTDPRYFRDQLAAGELPFSGGGAGVAWIDTCDIAAVAERALLEEGYSGQIHELSGPEALTLPHTAQVLAAALGRPVVHQELTIEESVAGMDGFERQLFVTTLGRPHVGVFAGVTDTVERVTGRPPRTLQTFLADS
jgi:uncharacterized protein YbjT (DUF2867 family)